MKCTYCPSQSIDSVSRRLSLISVDFQRSRRLSLSEATRPKHFRDKTVLRLLRTQAAVAGCARDVITERGPTMLAAMGAAIGMGGAPLPA
eukprot:COSAG06_NODE_27134_length_600_cov_0.690619_2_plen_89_part_01